MNLDPANPEIHYQYASALMESGETVKAKPHYEAAQIAQPDLSARLLEESRALAGQNKLKAAARASAAIELAPEDPMTLTRAGLVFLQIGGGSEAANALEKAYRLQPTPELAFNLGLARLIQHQPKEALALFESILQSRPEWAMALNEMAWLLATSPDEAVRNGQKAVTAAEKAVALTGRKEARFLGTLDAAYAEAGRFEDAIRYRGGNQNRG